MTAATSIDPAAPVAPALDFHALREQGLEEIRRLAGATWTDHNLHDPGITLLEALCYGITDAAYRTTAADADLFAGPDADPFPTARETLTCEPVTANDYRRLVLDAFPEAVRNVWVEPATRTLFADPDTRQLSFSPGGRGIAFEVRGFHRIRLQLQQAWMTPSRAAERTALLGSVARLFHAHRNLGETLHSVAITGSLPIRICADIQLAPDADVEATHAALVHALQEFLNPAVPRHPLLELVARGCQAGEIFDGPPLLHGFILEEDLERTTSVEVVRGSDLIAEMLAIPGVVAIPRLLLNLSGAAEDSQRWELPIPGELEPTLDFTDARLRFFKDLIPFLPDLPRSLGLLETLREEARQAAGLPDAGDFPVPAGHWSDPSEFTSLQQALPATYGCGSRGIDRDRSPAALGRARQLQAFLLVFDQILANDLGPLAGLGRLFSADPELAGTRFARAVAGIPRLAPLLKATADGGEDEAAAAYAAALESIPAGGPAHRSAILDHLLARRGELASPEVLLHHGAEGKRDPAARIRTKAVLLGELPTLLARRARGHDLTDREGIWDTANVSGFEHRLARLLGFPTYHRRSVSDVTYDFYQEKDADHRSEIRFRIVDRKAARKKTLLSGTTRHATKEAARAEMRRAIALGMTPANYDVFEAADATWYVRIVDRAIDDTVAIRKQGFATEAAALVVRDELAALLTDRFSEEACFLVEHLPMMPRDGSWPVLAAPLEAGPEDPASWDPYSFRVHLILPGWGARFADPGFRAFVERTIRRELPAHLVARVCFIGREPMQEFERHYRAWLTALAGDPADAAEVLAGFITCLEGLHTIHPTGTLHDFKEDGDERNPIVLGRTHLGSNGPPEI